jgi:hypothetical protein
MEAIAERKREKVVLQEKIGMLTAEYATMTSKSRVSQQCEDGMGMVSATMGDVVRVAVEADAMPEAADEPRIRVDEVLGSGMNDLTQVIGK